MLMLLLLLLKLELLVAAIADSSDTIANAFTTFCLSLAVVTLAWEVWKLKSAFIEDPDS